MKKVILFATPLLLAVIVFSAALYFFNKDSGKGALQVTANPKSNIILNKTHLGQTPLCKCEGEDMLQSGEYTIRIVPIEAGFAPFEERITITKSVLTVVDRSFGKSSDSEGSIITLSPLVDPKKLELLIMSFPEKAEVFLDNSPSGQTPLLLKNVTDSDHELRLVKEGYNEKIVRIRTVLGYKLSTKVFLGVSQEILKKEEAPVASPSATPKVSTVVILDTPTGFLRVRADATIGAAEVARVAPGDVLELIGKKEDWYHIKLTDGKQGWISNQYAKVE